MEQLSEEIRQLPSLKLKKYPDLHYSQLALIRAMSDTEFYPSRKIIKAANDFLTESGFGWRLHHGTATQLTRIVEWNYAEREALDNRSWLYRRTSQGLYVMHANFEKYRRGSESSFV